MTTTRAAAPTTGDVRAGSTPLAGVVRHLAWRGIIRMRRLPALLIPIIVMPMFFAIAYTGTFDGLTDVRGYPTDRVINWVLAFSVLQGAQFAGIGAAGVVSNDLDNGFIDRLLVAPVNRAAIVLGPLGYAAVRSLVPTTLVLAAGFAAGARLEGGPAGLVTLYLGAMGFAMVIGLFGIAMVLRIGNIRAMTVVQLLAFLALFVSIGQVPLTLLTGWLHDAARFNPVTNVLRFARQGFLGPVTWDQTWPGLVALAGMAAPFVVWIRVELRRLG
ncbi:MAG: hypothetical protein D6683_03175 [Actinomyces sp.]|nr:MAG: hypothetical protein D6683_03175 [Actinomyces sp.]